MINSKRTLLLLATGLPEPTVDLRGLGEAGTEGLTRAQEEPIVDLLVPEVPLAQLEDTYR